MDNINFFSADNYLFLPNKKNPKVALAITDSKIANNSFKLYNPFSKKAQFLKHIAYSASTNLNSLVKATVSQKKEKNSSFINYLESKLDIKLISSIYYATIMDKVVIQLQSKDAIIGYIKFPLNNIGIKHIENEIAAIDTLSKINMSKKYILIDRYKGFPYVLLEPLDGDISFVDRKDIENILDKLKLESSYSLCKHPRVINIKNEALNKGLSKYASDIDKICISSKEQYKIVYEHGDFAPWNIIKIDNSYYPFDFEYFEKEGLEYFDLIKYYYQTGKLLKNMKEEELIEYISKEINIKEIKLLLKLFLIKEIVYYSENTDSYEQNILKKLEIV